MNYDNILQNSIKSVDDNERAFEFAAECAAKIFDIMGWTNGTGNIPTVKEIKKAYMEKIEELLNNPKINKIESGRLGVEIMREEGCEVHPELISFNLTISLGHMFF